MELEKIATNAVETSIAKSDRLTSFISRGDKEPCWDGNIYIHESATHNKKNLKKVSIQVKGKAVTSDEVKETIKYRISRDDLNAYMMNGGTVFFVVYIDKETGEALEIYYTELLPLKIKIILKNHQKSYEVEFKKFTKNNYEKTAVFEKFYGDAQRQASFAGKEPPSIEELSKKGILESLTFHCVGYGNYCTPKSVPKIMEGKSLSIYANVKGYSCPIPVEYVDSIHHVMMSENSSSPITVNGIRYYDGFTRIITADNIEICIGSCVKIIFTHCAEENRSIPTKMKVRICGTLKQRIAGIEFINALIKQKKFSIGKIEFPAKFSTAELKKIGAERFSEILTGYKRIQSLLDYMNVKKDLDIQSCDANDFKKLNMLIATICDGQPVKDPPSTPTNLQEIKISNLLLAVVYLKRSDGAYNIYDYFSSHFDVTWSPDGSESIPVSQFFSMGLEDFLRFDNIDLISIVEDFKRFEANDYYVEYVNNILLNILKAYDKKPSPDLLNAARQLSIWLQKYPTLIRKEIAVLNHLQIILRERELSHQEKSEIYSIIEKSSDDYVRLGSFLLLDEQREAEAILESLDKDKIESFKEFPIYRFYKDPAAKKDNG